MKKLEKIEIMERSHDPMYDCFRRLTLAIQKECGGSIYVEVVSGTVDFLEETLEFVRYEMENSLEKSQM